MDIGTIQKRIEAMERCQENIKNSREMLRGELENDSAYIEAVEEAKAVAQKRKRIKEEISNRGSNKKLLLEIDENQEELETLQDILSAELTEYYVENKSDEIQDSEGEPRKFKLIGKLVPKKGHSTKKFGQND